ncbi:MAG: hydroxymethylglutaryl-CoA reductase, degradative [Candidatus Methylarchaceae archaeon HK01B]|nr:hydroxymethylglutaryl-CoA reductase, degradative [Candidatus Methylarchaceae archaeon HK01B]
MGRTSEISGFYKLSPEERLEIVKEFSSLSDDEASPLRSMGGLKLELADRMIENVISAMPVPLGIAVNFLINGKDYLIPMAIEEPSVVAAASNAAKMARVKGGFFTSSTDPVMIGQIQAIDIRDPHGSKMSILSVKEEILAKANEQDPILVSLGGGAKDLDVKVIDTIKGPMVITELLVDCKDAMGANAVNTMAEAVSPIIERVTKGRVLLRIISNLATKRLARSRVVMDKDSIGGEEVVDGVVDAFAFADADPYRCATHNKGIMNGIIAVALATGNDTRALEVGAHAYAARTGHYKPLTIWEKNEDGDLVGTIELPIAVGVIGGATAVHPVAKVCRKIIGVKSALELAEVMVAVGLAQNFAALRALATEGIQRGHMKLHARNVAIMAGAKGGIIDRIAAKMVEEGKVSIDRAEELLKEIRDS